MFKKLLLSLFVLSAFQISIAQQAAVLGNCLYDNTSNRITIRLAIENNTSSNLYYVGQRWGIQFNSAAVTYAGYFSFMYNGTTQSTGLNDASALTGIGADTGPSPAFTVETPSSRVANITGGGTKTLQIIAINRSTNICSNAFTIAPNEYRVVLDIYFTLNNPSQAAFYNLNQPGYGFNTPDFIAQFLTKSNGGHTGALESAKKEIAIVIIRNGNISNNPYQPYSMNSCIIGNVNPVTVGGDDINFFSPINGVLSGKIKAASGAARNGFAELNWDVENNQMVDRYEIQRKDAAGNFKTVALTLSDNNPQTKQYRYKEKLVDLEQLIQYRIKAICMDGTESISNLISINSKQTANAEIRITPNPVTNFVQMQLPEINGTYTCRVFNSEGKMVLHKQVLAVSTRMNVDQLVKGTYFMEAYHPQTGNRYFGKFSKQ